jgi:HK97 family phage major capsid protein
MSSETATIIRQTGGLTAYAMNETGAATESSIALDRVNLIAKKFGCVTVFSSELKEDAVINMADKLAGDMAYAFALKEDQCGFVGDGSATYHGIVGVATQLVTVNGVDEGGGIIVGTGNLASESVIGDWGKVPGLVPTYVDPARCKWYMHKNTWSTGALRLEIALAGNTWPIVQNGSMAPTFLGYPIEFVQCMANPTTTMSEVLAIFGDLSLAATMGDRRSMSVKVGSEGTVGSVNLLEQDASAIISTTRFDINVHDVGTATAAGPVVALIGTAS